MASGWLDDPSRIWKCKEAVEQKVQIVDVLTEWGIRLKPSYGQAFEWKARCPLPGHVGKGADGRERTPSFCVSRKNNFHCFGCNTHGGVVKLVSLVQGIPQIETLRLLAKRAGLIDENGKLDESALSAIPVREKVEFDESKTAEFHIRRANAALRDHMYDFMESPEFEREFSWFEKMGARIDELVVGIAYEDWERALSLHQQVVVAIGKRKGRFE